MKLRDNIHGDVAYARSIQELLSAAEAVIVEWRVRGDNRCGKQIQERLIEAVEADAP